MRALLLELGEPQQRFPAIHVVGTNGKSTTTRLTEALLLDAGLSVGSYLSPHIRSWSERIRVDGEEADFEAAVAAVRPVVESLRATQFEALTVAALLAFAAAEVDVAVVEAGLGGRHDATNVLDSRVVVLTSVALDHMDVLGETREAIAAEKLAVVQPGCTVVLSEPEWRERAEQNGAGAVVVTGRSNLALAIAAAESFLDRPVDPHAADGVASARPARAARRRPARDLGRSAQPRGHRLAAAAAPGGARRLDRRLLDPRATSGPAMMLQALSVLGPVLVATESRNGRALLGRGARCARLRQLRAGGGRARPGVRARACPRARGRRRRRARHGLSVPSGRPELALV